MSSGMWREGISVSEDSFMELLIILKIWTASYSEYAVPRMELLNAVNRLIYSVIQKDGLTS